MRKAARMQAQHAGTEVVAAEKLTAMKKDHFVDVFVIILYVRNYNSALDVCENLARVSRLIANWDRKPSRSVPIRRRR
jgi:hypothetical protein